MHRRRRRRPLIAAAATTRELTGANRGAVPLQKLGPHQHLGEKEWFSPPRPGSFLLRRNSCSFSFTSVLAMAPGVGGQHESGERDRDGGGSRTGALGSGGLGRRRPTLFAFLFVPQQQQLLLQTVLLLLLVPLLLQLPLLLHLLLPLGRQQLLLLLKQNIHNVVYIYFF